LGYGEPIDGKGGERKTRTETESGYSETTEHKPHPKTWWKGFKRAARLLTVLALPEIASRISRELADVSEEDIKELDKYRSEWRRYGTFLYFRRNGKLNALDLTFINPWGQLLRSVKITNDMRRDILSGRMTGLGALGESINFMAHPVFDMFSILLLGRKPGYGQKLPETDNEIKNLFNRVTEAVKYVWMPQSLPIPSIKHLVKEGKIKPGALTTQTIKGILDAYWGKASPLTGQGKELNREVIAFFSGLRTWEVDFESMIVRYQVGLRAKLSETQRNLSTWAKQKVVAKEVKGRKEYELAITPWEKAEKIKEIQGQLERLGKLFEESSKLLEKLRKGGI